MTPQALYPVLVFVHVLAAIVLLGSSLFTPLVRASIRSAATVGEVRTWLGFARSMGRFNPAASLLVLATGVYLGSFGWWNAPWFAVALGAFLVNLILALRVVKPLGMSLASLLGGPAETRIPEAADRRRRTPSWELATDAMIANDCVLLFLMLGKPGLGTSLALLFAAQVGMILLRGMFRLIGRTQASAA